MGGKASLPKGELSHSKVEQKLVQEMQHRSQNRSAGKSEVKTLNSIILKFPKIDDSFQAARTVFKKYDKNGDGVMDLEELKFLFEDLQLSFADEEIKSVFAASDMDCNKGVDFKEFIVLLSLVYFLWKPAEADNTKSRIGFPQLEATFETIVDGFVFLDSNGDGYLSKDEILAAIKQVNPQGKSESICLRRFEEMDWDKNGLVTFKEFLFAFTDWVGLDNDEDDEDNEGE